MALCRNSVLPFLGVIHSCKPCWECSNCHGCSCLPRGGTPSRCIPPSWMVSASPLGSRPDNYVNCEIKTISLQTDLVKVTTFSPEHSIHQPSDMLSSGAAPHSDQPQRDGGTPHHNIRNNREAPVSQSCSKTRGIPNRNCHFNQSGRL